MTDNNDDMTEMIRAALESTKADRMRNDIASIIDLDMSILYAIRAGLSDASIPELNRYGRRLHRLTDDLKDLLMVDKGEHNKEQAKVRDDKKELDDFFRTMEE